MTARRIKLAEKTTLGDWVGEKLCIISTVLTRYTSNKFCLSQVYSRGPVRNSCEGPIDLTYGYSVKNGSLHTDYRRQKAIKSTKRFTRR